MKPTKIVYWIATAIVSLMMVFSAYAYFTKPELKMAFQHLGFPDYFRVQLGTAKLIGAILLVAPVGKRIREWTYAGFAITFVSAFIAHMANGDAANHTMMPLLFLLVLIVSYVSYHRLQTTVRRPATVLQAS